MPALPRAMPTTLVTALLAVVFGLAALSAAPAAGAATIFSDDFETGSLSAWSSVRTSTGGSATVQSHPVRSGTRAARLAATSGEGSLAYARKTLSGARTQLTVAADVRLVSDGSSGNVPLLRLFDPAGTRLISLYRQNRDSDKLYVQHSGRYNSTGGTLALHSWARLEVTIKIVDGADTVIVRHDGSPIYQTTSASLGTAGVQALQLGNDTSGQPFDLVADDMLATTPDAAEPAAAPSGGGCDPSASKPWTGDPGSIVVADNFESGLGQWTVAQQGDAGVTTQSQIVQAGGCAARIAVTANSGSLGNLTRYLPSGTREVWSDGWFHFEEQGISSSWNTPTFRFFSDGRRVLDVSRQNQSAGLFVRYPNGSGGWTIRSTGQYPSLRRWHHVKIHARANWSSSTVEVWLNGSRIFATSSATLGTSRLSAQMVGADHARQEGVVAVDDVVVKARP